jgi:hypothetical protein
MEKTDSFIFYRSFFEAAKDLNSADKLAVYDAIFEYVFENKRKKLSGICGIILTLVIPNIDAALRNRENGKKGGRPKKETSVPENKKGGFSEKKTDGLKKSETNKDVNSDVDVDVNLDGNADEDNSLPFTDPLPELPEGLSSDEEKPKRKIASTYTEDFEKFWRAYPSKVGKADAAKKFQKAIKIIPFDSLISAVERYCKSKKVLDGYVCNPATWLHQERWNDLEVTVSDDPSRPPGAVRKTASGWWLDKDGAVIMKPEFS